MKRFAQELADNENEVLVEAGISIYKEIFPKLFEASNMVMNYDMLENYIKILAKAQKWKDLIKTKYKIIAHYRESKQVDHRTRRSFLEIICV